MLKSDVEGLEPQSLRTASRLLSLGLVERELRYNDIAGNSDVEIREQFAAFSYTLRFR
jgi:hypothetical protein